MVEIPEYLTVRTSFRNSKTSFKEAIEGREFFFSCTKSNSFVVECYDISTGILLIATTKDIDGAKEWVKLNIEEINNRLSQYEYQEPNLFA